MKEVSRNDSVIKSVSVKLTYRDFIDLQKLAFDLCFRGITPLLQQIISELLNRARVEKDGVKFFKDFLGEENGK